MLRTQEVSSFSLHRGTWRLSLKEKLCRIIVLHDGEVHQEVDIGDHQAAG